MLAEWIVNWNYVESYFRTENIFFQWALIKINWFSLKIFFAVIYKLRVWEYVHFESGLRIGRFAVQTPQGARPGLGTQPRYEVPNDFRVEIVQT